jgi:L-asparaginase II
MGNDAERRQTETYSEERRQFIAKCGRFAVVTPPTMVLMLSAVDRNYAQAFSGNNIDDRRRRVIRRRIIRRIVNRDQP